MLKKSSSSARALRGSRSRASSGAAGIPVTLIDRQNHHLFQPLLYQVATAALSPADIAEPIRKMLRHYPGVEVVLGEVARIDARQRSVTLASGASYPYDILVLATGATHSYFGHDEWSAFAPGLKTIEDARIIRSRLLLAFERAEMSRDPAEQKRLMTIAVIGGGPTGVELAGSIAELARYTLAKDFHRIRAETATVLLVEAGPRILTAFPEELASYAVRKLTTLGVTVRTACAVERITDRGIVAGGEEIGVGLAIWAAGVRRVTAGRDARRRDRPRRTRQGQSAICPFRVSRTSMRSATSRWRWTHTASRSRDSRRSPSRRANIWDARSRGRSSTAKRRSRSSSTTAATPRSSADTPRCSISAGRR